MTKEYEELLKGMGGPVSSMKLAFERLAQGDKEGAAQEIKRRVEEVAGSRGHGGELGGPGHGGGQESGRQGAGGEGDGQVSQEQTVAGAQGVLNVAEGDPLKVQLPRPMRLPIL